MKLGEFAQLLEDEGLGIRGKSIFEHRMPETVAQGILLLTRFNPIDYELPGLRRGNFQAIIRHTDFAQGQALAEAVSQALYLENQALTGMDIHWVRARHEPIVFPVSKGDFLEFSVNFEAVYVTT